jgi:hypothetical protein
VVVEEGVGKMVGKSAAKGGSVAGGFVYGGSVIGLGLDVVVGLKLGSVDDVGFVVGIKLGLPVVGIDVDDIVGSNVGFDVVGLDVTGIAVGVFVEGENDGLEDVGLYVTGLDEGIFVVGMMGDFRTKSIETCTTCLSSIYGITTLFLTLKVVSGIIWMWKCILTPSINPYSTIIGIPFAFVWVD